MSENEEIDDLPIDPSPTAILKPVIKTVLPISVEAIKMFTSGRRIMICGPKNAGKTHFRDYLIEGLLLPEIPEDDSVSTFDFEDEKRRVFKYGNNASQVLRIKKFIDSPGELNPKYQVKKLEEEKPTCLIIYLDCNSYSIDKDASSSISWMKSFTPFLKNSLIRNRKFNERLKFTIIVLNKADKINDRDYQNLREKISGLRDKDLTDDYVNYLPKQRKIPIFKCISVEHKNAENLLSRLIRTIIARIK